MGFLGFGDLGTWPSRQLERWVRRTANNVVTHLHTVCTYAWHVASAEIGQWYVMRAVITTFGQLATCCQRSKNLDHAMGFPT